MKKKIVSIHRGCDCEETNKSTHSVNEIIQQCYWNKANRQKSTFLDIVNKDLKKYSNTNLTASVRPPSRKP